MIENSGDGRETVLWFELISGSEVAGQIQVELDNSGYYDTVQHN